MAGLSRAAALLIALVLVGTGARAETYQILEGALSIGEGSESETLTGSLDVSFHSFASGSTLDGVDTPEQTYLLVDDFAMQAGDRSFTPNPLPQFYGGHWIHLLQESDHIRLVEDRVRRIQLRSGGEVVASSSKGQVAEVSTG